VIKLIGLRKVFVQQAKGDQRLFSGESAGLNSKVLRLISRPLELREERGLNCRIPVLISEPIITNHIEPSPVVSLDPPSLGQTLNGRFVPADFVTRMSQIGPVSAGRQISLAHLSLMHGQAIAAAAGCIGRFLQ
jgi:hypothetical protein